MIRNPERLLQGCPPGTVQAYKLRLLEHFLLRPLSERWDITLTSAYRTATAQGALYALDQARAQRKAKGVSQHSLGEAVDFEPDGSITDCFLWCADRLRFWQLILEYDRTRPECIHLSLPSERPEIRRKTLLFYGGVWQNFDGRLPGTASGGPAA